jgi:hypothetical protein
MVAASGSVLFEFMVLVFGIYQGHYLILGIVMGYSKKFASLL